MMSPAELEKRSRAPLPNKLWAPELQGTSHDWNSRALGKSERRKALVLLTRPNLSLPIKKLPRHSSFQIFDHPSRCLGSVSPRSRSSRRLCVRQLTTQTQRRRRRGCGHSMLDIFADHPPGCSAADGALHGRWPGHCLGHQRCSELYVEGYAHCHCRHALNAH